MTLKKHNGSIVSVIGSQQDGDHWIFECDGIPDLVDIVLFVEIGSESIPVTHAGNNKFLNGRCQVRVTRTAALHSS